MRKQKFISLDVKSHTPEWFRARHELGIGGSEIATILGLNPFEVAGELFYRKIELEPRIGTHSEDTLWGNELESVIARRWQHYEVGKFVENWANNKIVRKCRKLGKMIKNPDYPHLFANIDYEILRNPITPRGVLEIKNYRGFSIKQYVDEINPGALFQVLSYCAILEVDYCEICVLVDGHNLMVQPVTPNQELQGLIIKKTEDFWNKIVEARNILRSDMANEQKLLLIQDLEPEPDGTELYENFLKDRYKANNQSLPIAGTPQLKKWVKGYVRYKKLSKRIEDNIRLYSNKLKNVMKEAEVINFEEGEVSWRADKNNQRVFRISKKLEESL